MVAHGSTITASNTGYTAYFSPTLGRNLVLGDLTVISGDDYISDHFPAGTQASPTVVEGYHFTGQIKMDVDWITWRGCLFDHAVTLRPAGIDRVGGFFDYCSFLPASAEEWPIGHQGYSANRCRMEGHSDGPRVNGGPYPQYITECFIRLRMQSYLDHCDGGQNQDGAGDVYFLGCNIDTHVVQLYEPETGLIKGGPGVCVLSGDMATARHFHLEVSDCLLDGTAGDFTLGFRCGDIDPRITYKAARNQFVRGNGPVVYPDTPVNQITWFGNVYSDNGEAIPLAGSQGEDGAPAAATRTRTSTATAKRSGASAASSARVRTATGVAARLGAATATSARVRTRIATATRSATAAGTSARVRTAVVTAKRTNVSTAAGARLRSGVAAAIQVAAGEAVVVGSRLRSSTAAAVVGSPISAAGARLRSAAAAAVRVSAAAGSSARVRTRSATAARSAAASAVAARVRTRTATAVRRATAVAVAARVRTAVVTATVEYAPTATSVRYRTSFAQAETRYMGPFSTRSYIVVERPGFTTEDGFVGVGGSTYGDSELGETVYGDAPMWPSRKSWVEVG